MLTKDRPSKRWENLRALLALCAIQQNLPVGGK
jgi:hypothetical protein